MKKFDIEKHLTIESIRTYLRVILDGTFGKDGRLPATFICFGREKPTIVHAPHLPDGATKDKFVGDFRLFCTAEDALAAASLMEIWMSPPDTQGLRPSEHPDRREFVIVSIELPGNRGEVSLYPIIREGDAKPRLGQPQIFSEPNQGRLSQFLPAKPPTEGERIIAAASLKRNGRIYYPNTAQWN
jgi:hypothetical protein